MKVTQVKWQFTLKVYVVHFQWRAFSSLRWKCLKSFAARRQKRVPLHGDTFGVNLKSETASKVLECVLKLENDIDSFAFWVEIFGRKWEWYQEGTNFICTTSGCLPHLALSGIYLEEGLFCLT